MLQEAVTAPEQWIRRCARRIQQRHVVGLPEALELAIEVHRLIKGHACPERIADTLFTDRNAIPAA